jgi:hypothetical protein
MACLSYFGNPRFFSDTSLGRCRKYVERHSILRIGAKNRHREELYNVANKDMGMILRAVSVVGLESLASYFFPVSWNFDPMGFVLSIIIIINYNNGTPFVVLITLRQLMHIEQKKRHPISMDFTIT